MGIYYRSGHHEFVVVVDEIREAHEGRTPVLGQIAAHSARIAARACIQHHTKLVIVYPVSVPSNLPQVFLTSMTEMELLPCRW